jgi:hypothetical protein
MSLSRLSGRAVKALFLVLLALSSLLATLLVAPRAAHATDYYLEGGVLGGGTTWSPHDGNVQGTLRTGFAFARNIVGVEVEGRLGYAGVDQRILEGLGVGTKLSIPIRPVVPHLRLGMIHMHEEPVAAAKKDVAGAIVGVGDGIRHRFGVATAIGIDWIFADTKNKKLSFLASAEGYVNVFPDQKGPLLYAGGGLGLGLQYHL